MKTKIMGFVFAGILGVPGLCLAGSVGGFGGATEITQIMNNAELAVQSMQSELQSVELIEHTYLQRLQQMKSTIGPLTAPYQKTLDSYQKVKAMHDSLSVLNGKTQNYQGALQDRFKEFSASNLTWDQWKAREQKMIQQGNEVAITKIQTNQAALEGVKNSMEAYQKQADAMEATQGEHQATRVLGAQLTVLGGDVNRLITITAEANKEQGFKDLNIAAKQARDNKESDALKKGIDESRRVTEKAYKDMLRRNR